MMEFKSSKGIFQQIGDNLCEKILSGEFKAGEKVPSVREQAANLGVNHNTIMRTYTELQRDEIIINKRGVGFFVAENALDKIREVRRHEFFKQALPEFEHQVEVLKIAKSEVNSLITRLDENENK
ncbi:GntR family transcriptional regulator [bacterium]|nr:GntR family transcriptional regulator [bacterium]